MNNFDDLDPRQAAFARGLRDRLRSEQPLDGKTAAQLAAARRSAVAAAVQPRRLWSHGLEGLAIASVLMMLALVLPVGRWLHPIVPADIDQVEASLEALAPEFGEDPQLLQWLAGEPDPNV